MSDANLSERLENDLEYVLLTTQWLVDKVKHDAKYAQSLYAALCNNEFQRLDVIPILKDITWGCTWRHAGAIIARMQGHGDYLDWYCSGSEEGAVEEGRITHEVKQDLKHIKWIVLGDPLGE